MSQAKQLAKKVIPDVWHDVAKKTSRRLIHLGNRQYCNICNSHLREFKPLGLNLPVIKEKQVIGGGRRDAKCPVCFSSDRSRLLHLFIYEKLKVYGFPVHLLHIAPEISLRETFENDDMIDYLTADLMQKDVMVKMDLVDIQYPDATFDGIICSHVLEHIPDDHKAMSELFRVLKPGGWAILQVPISILLEKTYEDPAVVSPKEREKKFGQDDHVRIYGQDYVQRLELAGFTVTPYLWTEDPEIRRNTNLKKLGLNPEEKIFYCTKPDVKL